MPTADGRRAARHRTVRFQSLGLAVVLLLCWTLPLLRLLDPGGCLCSTDGGGCRAAFPIDGAAGCCTAPVEPTSCCTAPVEPTSCCTAPVEPRSCCSGPAEPVSCCDVPTETTGCCSGEASPARRGGSMRLRLRAPGCDCDHSQLVLLLDPTRWPSSGAPEGLAVRPSVLCDLLPAIPADAVHGDQRRSPETPPPRAERNV